MILLLLLQAGLVVGDMILAVNKDTLLGSDYDSVSISLYTCIFVVEVLTLSNLALFTSH